MKHMKFCLMKKKENNMIQKYLKKKLLTIRKIIQVINILGHYQNTPPQNKKPFNENINYNSVDKEELFNKYEEKLEHDRQLQQKLEQAQQQAEAQLKYEQEYNKKMNTAINKAYYDAYIQDLKNRGYKIRYKKTFKDYLTGFISIIAVIILFYLLWLIPFIRNFFISLYEENDILHAIVDAFLNMFKN